MLLTNSPLDKLRSRRLGVGGGRALQSGASTHAVAGPLPLRRPLPGLQAREVGRAEPAEQQGQTAPPLQRRHGYPGPDSMLLQPPALPAQPAMQAMHWGSGTNAPNAQAVRQALGETTEPWDAAAQQEVSHNTQCRQQSAPSVEPSVEPLHSSGRVAALLRHWACQNACSAMEVYVVESCWQAFCTG